MNSFFENILAQLFQKKERDGDGVIDDFLCRGQ